MNNRNQAIKYGSPFIPEPGCKHVGPLIPEFGYLRLRQIIGDSKADPPIPAILPICASSWWAGVKRGDYPAPVKLSKNCTAWKISDIKALLERIDNQEGEAA